MGERSIQNSMFANDLLRQLRHPIPSPAINCFMSNLSGVPRCSIVWEMNMRCRVETQGHPLVEPPRCVYIPVHVHGT